ncbi:MAG: dioxygenase [Pseudomonadota bacterium]
MRNVTSDTITEAFLKTFGSETNPRLAFIMERFAHHLHAFARETNLTHEEWMRGIQFLEATGAISDDKRHEFVLLSDIFGLSALVDMLHSPEDGTSSSVLGPFHQENAPPLAVGGDLKKDNPGDVVLVEGIVKSVDGTPLGGAKIDIWQTATNGLYAAQDEAMAPFEFHATMVTGEDGRYAFTTVRPAPYTVPTDGPVGELLEATGRHPWRPSHLHFIVAANGHRRLVTEVFPRDDAYLDEDAVFGVRDDLIMEYVPQPPGTFPAGLELSGKVDGPWWKVSFDLVLCALKTAAPEKTLENCNAD